MDTFPDRTKLFVISSKTNILPASSSDASRWIRIGNDCRGRIHEERVYWNTMGKSYLAADGQK
jgi:hypothetical protein